MADLIDPWASFSLDYDKLVNQFGIGKISDIIDDIKNPQRLMKRGVIFGHREFNDNRISNHYLITVDDKELNIPIEMANNIFIRV